MNEGGPLEPDRLPEPIDLYLAAEDLEDRTPSSSHDAFFSEPVTGRQP